MKVAPPSTLLPVMTDPNNEVGSIQRWNQHSTSTFNHPQFHRHELQQQQQQPLWATPGVTPAISMRNPALPYHSGTAVARPSKSTSLPPDRCKSPLSPPSSVGSGGSSPAAAMSFFARAAQRLGAPSRRKKHHSHHVTPQSQFPTNFRSVITVNPPPAPACLLRPLGHLTGQSVSATRVKVLLRVCPSEGNHSSILNVDTRTKQVILFDPSQTTANHSMSQRHVVPPKMFAFDAVFTPSDPLAEVCATGLVDIIQSVVGGIDGCLFCYGHARIGKTYTMLGVDESPSTLGVIPCAIDWLFRLINDQKEQTGARFSVRVSAVEITGKQEVLKDLLSDIAKATEAGGMTSPGIYLRDDPVCGTQLENQSELRAPTAEHAAHFLDAAIAARTVSDVEDDARNSHLLFTIHVYQYRVERTSEGQNGVAGGRSRLHLLDLGSCSRSKDGTALSLSALGTVLLALLNGQRHLPYRESKLTQVIKESMSNARSCMIAHVSPAAHSFNETLQVLQLASRIHRMRGRKKTSSKLPSTSSEDSSSCSGESSRMRAGGRLRLGVRMGTLRDGGGYRARRHLDYTSSSEQSCDTVIYIGSDGRPMSDRELTDCEGPPRSRSDTEGPARSRSDCEGPPASRLAYKLSHSSRTVRSDLDEPLREGEVSSFDGDSALKRNADRQPLQRVLPRASKNMPRTLPHSRLSRMVGAGLHNGEKEVTDQTRQGSSDGGFSGHLKWALNGGAKSDGAGEMWIDGPRSLVKNVEQWVDGPSAFRMGTGGNEVPQESRTRGENSSHDDGQQASISHGAQLPMMCHVNHESGNSTRQQNRLTVVAECHNEDASYFDDNSALNPIEPHPLPVSQDGGEQMAGKQENIVVPVVDVLQCQENLQILEDLEETEPESESLSQTVPPQSDNEYMTQNCDELTDTRSSTPELADMHQENNNKVTTSAIEDDEELPKLADRNSESESHDDQAASDKFPAVFTSKHKLDVTALLLANRESIYELQMDEELETGSRESLQQLVCGSDDDWSTWGSCPRKLKGGTEDFGDQELRRKYYDEMKMMSASFGGLLNSPDVELTDLVVGADSSNDDVAVLALNKDENDQEVDDCEMQPYVQDAQPLLMEASELVTEAEKKINELSPECTDEGSREVSDAATSEDVINADAVVSIEPAVTDAAADVCDDKLVTPPPVLSTFAKKSTRLSILPKLATASQSRLSRKPPPIPVRSSSQSTVSSPGTTTVDMPLSAGSSPLKPAVPQKPGLPVPKNGLASRGLFLKESSATKETRTNVFSVSRVAQKAPSAADCLPPTAAGTTLKSVIPRPSSAGSDTASITRRQTSLTSQASPKQPSVPVPAATPTQTPTLLPKFRSRIALPSHKDKKPKSADAARKIENCAASTISCSSDPVPLLVEEVPETTLRLLSPYHKVTQPRPAGRSSGSHCSSDNSSSVFSDRGISFSSYGRRRDGKSRSEVEASSGYESMIRDSEEVTGTSSNQDSASESQSAAKLKGTRTFRKRVKGRSRSAPARGHLTDGGLIPRPWGFMEEPVEIKVYDVDDVERMARWRQQEAEVYQLQTRRQQIQDLLDKQESLKRELADAKTMLMVEPSSWSYDLHVAEKNSQRDDADYLAALEAETSILDKRVRACRSRIMVITVFDVTAQTTV